MKKTIVMETTVLLKIIWEGWGPRAISLGNEIQTRQASKCPWHPEATNSTLNPKRVVGLGLFTHPNPQTYATAGLQFRYEILLSICQA